MGQGDQRRTTAVSYESVRAKGLRAPKILKKRLMGDGQIRASSVELPWSAHCVEISRHIRSVLISHAFFRHRGMRVDLTRMLVQDRKLSGVFSSIPARDTQETR
jgi:hypothetical protein